MKKFIRRPNIELLPGIRVGKDTKIDFKNENTEQTIENLVLHSKTAVKGEGYEISNDITVYLEEGDVLIFEEDGRGYMKPAEAFVDIEEAIDDLINIKDLG